MGGVSMETYKLSDLCEILDSKRKPLSALQRAKKQGIYPYYGAQGIIDHLDEYLLDGEYLLVAEDGANLETRNQPIANIANGKIWVNNHAHVLGNNGKCPLNLLGFILNNMNISPYVTGCAQPKLNQENLRNIEIELPSHIDRIASILSSLDQKIELNNKINADLEEMAQAIFKNWLSECSDDVTIGELSLNITNYEKTDAEEVVLINSSDVTEGYFDHHNYSPNKNLKGHFKKRFQKGDILYSQVRPRNRHWAYCNFDANDYLASTQLMVIRNNPSLITSILLYQYIISDNVWKEFTLKTETRSGTFPQGNYEDLSQIRVPYNSDVEGISNQLETLYAKMFMLEKENSRLSLLRDTLLPRLMSGELEVPE